MATANFVVAVDLDFQLYLNDTTAIQLDLRTSAEAPISLVGHVIKMQVRPSIGSPQVTEEYSTTNGRIVVSGASNNIITISNLELLPAGTFKYDLQSTVGAVVLTWAKGSINVTSDVTV
jgi:hypothetical protein